MQKQPPVIWPAAVEECKLLDYRYWSVVIAMIAMRMVQMSVNQVVNVVAMGHWFVTAARAVHMSCFVPFAGVAGCAAGRVGFSHVQRVFFDLTVGADVM